MKIPAKLNISEQPAARLGDAHGYRLDGDTVHLNADILCDAWRLTGQEWALQLWSDRGIKLAELALGLLYPDGNGRVSVGGAAALLPPAGIGQHTLSLVLASGAFGTCDTQEDSATYPQPVHFVQPRFRGHVGGRLADGLLSLDLDCIENPRDADNLSGTLALEVWALEAPYGGGSWSGVPVASVVLGTLAGQSEWSDCHFDAHAGPLPAIGHLTLMLREWTPAGYLTRDYRILPLAGAAEPDAAAVAEAAPVKKTPAATKPAAGKAPTGKAAKAPKADKTEKAEKAEKAGKAAKAGKADKPAKAAAGQAPSAAASQGGHPPPSVNSATLAELGAVPGIGPVLARAIVAARPYVSLDELTRAKGMGDKLLASLRKSIKL